MIRLRILGLLVLSLGLVPSGLFAQDNPQRRLRGTVETVYGQNLSVRTRAGDIVPVRLAENFTLAAVVQASLADIKEGAFVGSTAMPQPDGTLMAMEVHIFPEAQRGLGEGFRPWDLVPDSTMTNANVSSRVESVAGPVLTMTYRGGEKKIVVPPEAAIVSYVPAEPSELRAGAAVYLAAEQLPDGALRAFRVIVGRNGVVPPM